MHVLQMFIYTNIYSYNKLEEQDKHVFKTQKIRPIIGGWPLGYRKIRREELVLARLHIGHTHLTHSFFLKNEESLICTACQKLYTIEHILIACTNFNHICKNSIKM